MRDAATDETSPEKPTDPQLRVSGRDIPALILGVAVLFVVGVNVVNASGRYLFGLSFTGADELMVYTVIWIVMAGTVLSMARRFHISLNLLPGYLPDRWRTLVFALHDLIGLLASVYATHASYLYTMRLAKLGMTSMGLGVPMVVPHGALVLGFGGLAVVCLSLLVRDLRAFIRDEDHAEPGAR